MDKIRVAIMGYGNIGKAAEALIPSFPDMQLKYIFSRRSLDHPLYQPVEDVLSFKEDIDVLLLCGGSKSDIPYDGPVYSRHFCTVDSYDNHNNMAAYLIELNEGALIGKKTCISGAGWDPGLFSITRVLFQSFLPEGITHTFWGKGVSQGHSQAIRSIDGVADAVQYTVPIDNTLERVRKGQQIELDASQKHHRLCYVVAKPNADQNRISNAIRSMPDYFADYYTTVNFVTQEELNANHKKLSHGGLVIRGGNTTKENTHKLELSVKLDSNPEFTASIMLTYVRACYHLHTEDKIGALTPLDVAPMYLLEEQHKKNLIKFL